MSDAAAITARDRAMLALSLTPQLGATRIRRLFEHIPQVEDIFRASLTELEAAGLAAPSAQSIAQGNSFRLADEELKKLGKLFDVSLVTYGSHFYPVHPAEIYDPPLILYIRGEKRSLPDPAIAVIGTRHPTPYGLGVAERLSQDLANCGLVIISGMARGIDAMAHKGGVQAHVRTITVFGTRVPIIYPPENRNVDEQILRRAGPLVTVREIGEPSKQRDGRFRPRALLFAFINTNRLSTPGYVRSNALRGASSVRGSGSVRVVKVILQSPWSLGRCTAPVPAVCALWTRGA